MTNEELVAAIQQGRTELMEQLWGQVRGFVYRKAREAMSRVGPGCGVELDDLMQAGYIALVAAVQSFDPAKSSFAHWLSFHLMHEFCASGGYPLGANSPQEDSFKWTYKNPLNGAASLYAPLKAGDPEEGVLADIVAHIREDGGDGYTDVEDAIYNDQLHAALDSAIDRLTKAQATAIRGRYWGGLAYRELAEKCGVSLEQTKRDLSAGVRALRSPMLSRELSQFVDDRTGYFKGSSLQSFRTTGASSVERAVVRRENLEEQWLRLRRESNAAG